MNGGKLGVTINMGFPGTPLEHECFPQTLLFIEGNLGSIEVTPDFRVRVTTASGTHIERVPPPRYAWADPDYAVVHSSMVALPGRARRGDPRGPAGRDERGGQPEDDAPGVRRVSVRPRETSRPSRSVQDRRNRDERVGASISCLAASGRKEAVTAG